jgi:MULE transposase domain
MDTPVRPMGQPRPHYSLVNYSSSEDDFVTVLDSDEDENEGNENDGFENDSFEEEGVEDEGFGQTCQSFIGNYSPFADEDFDQGQNAIDDYYNFDEDYDQGQNAIDYSLLIDEDFDQGQNAIDDYSLPLDEDSDQGQNAIDDSSLPPDDLQPPSSLSDPDSDDEQPRHRADLPPPPESTYTTSDEASTAINSFATMHGYAVSVKRSVKKKGVLKHIYYQCVRGGPFRAGVDEPHRKRQKTSRRSECPFDAVIDFHASTEEWLLRIRDARHNHNPMPQSTLPEYRRKQLCEKEGQVTAQIQSGSSTRRILASLRQEDPDIMIKPQDIRNHRFRKRVEFLDGLTPIQALLIALRENGDWVTNYRSEGDVVSAVFCIHRSSMSLLQRHPYVLVMDCTYKTNRYKMPLLDIVGVNALNKSFYVGFCFLSKEDADYYEFALQNLQSIYTQLTLEFPKTIIVDKDDALIRAANSVFPSSNVIICIWHVQMNILKRARPLFRHEIRDDPEDRDGEEYRKRLDEMWKSMLAMWNQVVYASTEGDMNEKWQQFKAYYSENRYTDFISYIEAEWLSPGTRERFVQAWVNDYLHFGNFATSRSEGAHGLIKRDLEVSTGDILTAVQSIERTLSHQHHRVEDELAAAQNTKPVRHLASPLLSRLLTKVSPVAINKVASIRDKYLPAGSRGRLPISETCTGVTTRTMGIPCVHTIKNFFDSGQPLTKANFHPQWHLEPENQAEISDPRLLLLEPRVVRPRGRPPGAVNQDHSTRRDASGFEHEIGTRGRRGRPRGSNQSGRGRGGQVQVQDQNQDQDQDRGRGQRRGPGRPRGSRLRQTAGARANQVQDEVQDQSQDRGRGQRRGPGRPRGSRSRQTARAGAAGVEQVDDRVEQVDDTE